MLESAGADASALFCSLLSEFICCTESGVLEELSEFDSLLLFDSFFCVALDVFVDDSIAALVLFEVSLCESVTAEPVAFSAGISIEDVSSDVEETAKESSNFGFSSAVDVVDETGRSVDGVGSDK